MIKNIIVCSAEWELSVSVDSKIFDDVYVESCTRSVEQLKSKNKLRMCSTIHCWDVKTPKKIITYNSYKILINAGMHRFAEVMRKHFLKNQDVDWATEPLKN